MPTTTELRRSLSAALEDLEVYHVNSGTLTTVTLPLLASTSPTASPNHRDGRGVYVASGPGAGQFRRVRIGGYEPSGRLTIDGVWQTIPTLGSIVELSGLFPPITETNETSYQVLINAALKRLLVPDRITLPITTANSYGLLSWPWLDREERLLGIYEPGPTGLLEVSAMWRRPKLRLDADLPVLEFRVPFLTATGSITLDVLRPADTWIAVNGVWQESVLGLYSETDQAIPSEQDVRDVALMEAYLVLAHRSPARPNGPWIEKYMAQREIARRIKYYDLSSEKAPAPQPAVPVPA